MSFSSNKKFISGEDFKLSRSKLELFLQCRRCFYLDRRLNIAQPASAPFTLNSAVDFLLKKEFDIYRQKKEPHPLMKKHKIKAIPFWHPEIDEWRNNFKGISFYHSPTKIILQGAIDDVWQNERGELIIVDYKATSINGEVSLDSSWKESYKRQIEIYQWLFKMNGFNVSRMGYFVYANGKKDVAGFGEKLEFDVRILPYEGNSFWVEEALFEARKCLEDEKIPPFNEKCPFCLYSQKIKEIEN